MLCVAVIAAPLGALAGNDDSFLMGSEAAVASGAVSAVGRGAGVLWYNPAGLGGVSRSKVDASVNAFVLSVRHLPNIVSSDLASGRLAGGVDDVDIRSVPTALAYVRSLSDTVSIGLGIYMPVNDQLSVRTALSANTTASIAPGAVIDYQQRATVSWHRSAYHIGPAVGWQVLPSLRIGAALYVTVGLDEEAFSALGEGRDASSGEDIRHVSREHDLVSTTIGARAVIGAQWEPTSNLVVALVVRSPEVAFYRWGRWTSVSDVPSEVSPDEPETSGLMFEDRSLSGWSVTPIVPWRFNLAMAYRFARGWLGVEGDLQTPVDEKTFGIHRALTWNVRVGLQFDVTDSLALGGGLFTDNAGQREPSAVGSWRANFYGGTFGVVLRTVVPRRGRHRDEPLLFTTTIAARYAIGLGESLGYLLAPFEDDSPSYEEAVNDVTFHEVTVHVGSGLTF